MKIRFLKLVYLAINYCGGPHHSTMWRSKADRVLFSHHVGSDAQTQAIGLGGCSFTIQAISLTPEVWLA